MVKTAFTILNINDDFKAIIVPKVDYVMKIRKTKNLTPKDVLISDFNNDLNHGLTLVVQQSNMQMELTIHIHTMDVTFQRHLQQNRLPIS